MQSRFLCFAASVLSLFAFSVAGCGGSDESTNGTGGESSSSSSGAGGTGGSSGPPFMTAAHPPAPTVVNLGGPALKTPKAILITYNADKNQADVDKFADQLSKSAYWPAATAEYGVGPLTIGTPIHLSTAPPKNITGVAVFNTLVTNLTGPNPLWGPPDPNAIYTFVFPEGTIVSDGGSPCCTDFDGYHYEAAVGATNVAYAINCTCPGFDGPQFTPLDDLTIVLSHEFVEAATDPFPETDPGWAQTADPDAAWSVITQGEVGDMCAFDGDQYVKPADMTYFVQRSWSNMAAAAGKDPCAPLLSPPDVYFNSAMVVTDDVPVPFFGTTLMGKGVKIPVGQSRTIDVDLFSEAPTAGPWTLKVVDYNEAYNGKANLTFSLDKSTGMNGDVLKLTITVVSADATLKAEPFWIESTLGNASNFWMGMVGQ